MEKFDSRYLEMAEIWAHNSYCKRRQVGALIVKDRMIISEVAKSGNSSEGAILYVTASPCLECSKLIIQSGIKRVVYRDEYRLTDGIDLLRKAGIIVEKIG